MSKINIAKEIVDAAINKDAVKVKDLFNQQVQSRLAPKIDQVRNQTFSDLDNKISKKAQ